MDKGIYKNTLIEFYPSYIKKAIIKLAVKEGLAINNRIKDNQLTLNFTDCVDVSDDETIEDKFRHILESEDVLAMIEEFEYEKPYRHFCYFDYSGLNTGKIEELVKNGKVNVFGKKNQRIIDDSEKPTIYILGESIYFKFTYTLQNFTGKTIKYVMLAVIDKDNQVLEIRFDRVSVAYKDSNNYYKDKISEILNYMKENVDLAVSDIDFKSVVDFIKTERDDITFMAKRMTRNGTTAYLEAYEDEASIIPILGELDSFIEKEKELFDRDDNTQEIRTKLRDFLRDIEEKSDMPLVKLRMDETGVKFGITHNYKGTNYSLFMLYGELIGEEMMSSVKEYIMRSYKDLRAATSANGLPEEEM